MNQEKENQQIVEITGDMIMDNQDFHPRKHIKYNETPQFTRKGLAAYIDTQLDSNPTGNPQEALFAWLDLLNLLEDDRRERPWFEADAWTNPEKRLYVGYMTIALERLSALDLVEYGVSCRTAWLEPLGVALLQALRAESCDGFEQLLDIEDYEEVYVK